MSVLFGPNGRKLDPAVTPLRHPAGFDARMAMNKARVEAWLKGTVGPGDRAGGRGAHNWPTPPAKCLTQEMVNALRARGIVAYVTAGQFVVADLTGANPRIRQRRPLAERFVELVDGPEARA